MQYHHWFMLAAVFVIALFVEKYLDPLGMIGL